MFDGRNLHVDLLVPSDLQLQPGGRRRLYILECQQDRVGSLEDHLLRQFAYLQRRELIGHKCLDLDRR